MEDPCNPVAQILASLPASEQCQRAVDLRIGPELTGRFAEALSAISAHGNPECDGLARVSEMASEAHRVISAAGVELQMAWQDLRLGSAPGAMRHGRVAAEFVGIASLVCMPRKELSDFLQGRHRKLPFTQAVLADAETPIWDLWAKPSGAGALRSDHAYTAFRCVLEGMLAFNEEDITNLREFHAETQNLASHATHVTMTYYLEEYRGAIGVQFQSERAETYVLTATALVDLARALERALACVSDWLRSRLARSSRRRIEREWGKAGK